MRSIRRTAPYLSLRLDVSHCVFFLNSGRVLRRPRSRFPSHAYFRSTNPERSGRAEGAPQYLTIVRTGPLGIHLARL